MNRTIEKLAHFKSYLELKNYQKSTIKQAIASAKEYEDYLAKSGNPRDYFRYLSQRQNKNNPSVKLRKSTLNTCIYLLKLYEKYQQNLGVEETSIYFIQSFKEDFSAIEILSIEEVESLFTSAETVRDKAVLACLYYLGLRAGETAGLLLEDIDLEKNWVLIRKTKTGRQRQVPIAGKAQVIFRDYLEVRKEKGNAFIQGLKGNLTHDGIAQIVKRTAKRSGIAKKIYPHLLRHSIATHLLKNGMELEQVSQFLGHTSLESTERYTHY